MNKEKIFLIIGLLILFVGVPAGVILISQTTSFRLGAQDPNLPENVKVTGLEADSVKITWTTPKAVQSLVSYGLTATNLSLIQPETSPTSQHEIILVRLKANSRYFFVIKVGEKNYLDENNQPFSFTTGTGATAVTPTVSLPTEAGFKTAMGTNNPVYDLNQDGVVNSFDLQLFRSQTK